MGGVSHLTVDVNQVHRLFRLIAVPCHFALLITKGQLEDRDTSALTEIFHNHLCFYLHN